MALNGVETITLTPFISALTIALNELTIPSLIPLNIFPPVENIFFTPFHAFSNVVLKKLPTVENTLFIPFQAPFAPFKKPFHRPTKKSPTGLMICS